MLSLNGASFVKVNAGFLKVEKAPASLCLTICGKYVELPALPPASQVVSVSGLS